MKVAENPDGFAFLHFTITWPSCQETLFVLDFIKWSRYVYVILLTETLTSLACDVYFLSSHRKELKGA